MNYETLLYGLDDNVATVTLNRPDVLNGLTTQMRAEILHAVKRAEGEARVLVFTGAGRAFCAGQDLGDASKIANIDLEGTLRDEYEPMLFAIFDCRIPTISAVNGMAAGAGANLALAADVVIASETASFLQAFSRIGLIPDAGGTYWLPRQIGMARAMGLALTGEALSGSQAAEWGLIWKSYDDAELMPAAHDLVTKFASGPTAAYAGTKKLMQAAASNSFDGHLDDEAVMQQACGRSDDYAEGVRAFLAKRPAEFTGS